MKTIIAGSRTIQSYDVVARAILDSDFSDLVTTIFTSMETGPGIFGYRWAIERRIPVRTFTADWKQHGKPAGIIRDREMVTFADAAILLCDPSDHMMAAMVKYTKQMDPKLRVYTTIWKPETQTLVEYGRISSTLENQTQST